MALRKSNAAPAAAPASDKKTTKGKADAAPATTKATGKGTQPAALAASRETYKFTVQDLADKLGIEPASARIKLRNEGIAKAGRSYGWNTQKDFDAVVKQLSAKPDKKAA